MIERWPRLTALVRAALGPVSDETIYDLLGLSIDNDDVRRSNDAYERLLACTCSARDAEIVIRASLRALGYMRAGSTQPRRLDS